MRRSIILLALLPLLFSSGSAIARDLTLEDAINTALKSNTTLINSEKTVKIFEQKVREYWATVFPSITLSAGYNRNLEIPAIFFNGTAIKIGQNNSFSGQASLSQILWSGGKVGSAIKLAQLMSDQAAEQHRLNRLNITRNVKEVYYRVLLASATAVIEQDNLALAQDHLQQMTAQYAQGLRSDLILLQQKVEVAKRQPSLIKAKNVSEVGLLSLKTLLAQDPDEDVTLTSAFDGAMAEPTLLPALYGKALADRPDVRIARLNYDTARQQYRLARANFLPSVYASASRSFSGQSDEGWASPDMRNWSSSVGVNLSWNFFS
ncbi:MAG TPA: TolC family protein, partial [Elusimicrobiales bacterium]|nr:TolC family protein [Elusimicrobiales bacterium]